MTICRPNSLDQAGRNHRLFPGQVASEEVAEADGVLIVTIDENEVYHLGVLLEALFPDAHRQMGQYLHPVERGWRRRLRVDGIGPTPWLTLVTDIRRVYSRGRHSRAAAQSDAAGGEPKLFGASRPVFRP